MQRTNNNYFTDGERQWLCTHMVEFCQLQGKRRARDDQGGTEMQAFLDRLLVEFERKFPYRHPRNAEDDSLTEEQEALVCTEAQWWRLPGVSIVGLVWTRPKLRVR